MVTKTDTLCIYTIPFINKQTVFHIYILQTSSHMAETFQQLPIYRRKVRVLDNHRYTHDPSMKRALCSLAFMNFFNRRTAIAIVSPTAAHVNKRSSACF